MQGPPSLNLRRSRSDAHGLNREEVATTVLFPRCRSRAAIERKSTVRYTRVARQLSSFRPQAHGRARESARGDTARCSPFPATAEATHVASRSFVIRQIAFLPARERSQVRVRRAYTLSRERAPSVCSRDYYYLNGQGRVIVDKQDPTPSFISFFYIII